MPSSQAILESLAAIVNAMEGLAVFWHAAVAALLVGLWLGWRPSKKLSVALLATPLLSVGILAFLFRNPFNGFMFLAAAALSLFLGFRPFDAPGKKTPRWVQAAGVLMISFGWLYPHFLDSSPWTAYLYAAPMGLIPCPTLSMIVGFSLYALNYLPRGWRFLTAFLGAFYGLFGVFRLGVTIDIVLLTGSVLLLIFIILSPQKGKKKTSVGAKESPA